MKPIEFKNQASQRVYNDYMNRCKRVIKILSDSDQQECLMEVNSYIYEYVNNHQHEEELTALLNIIERLGAPEVTLKEVVASKKINQAVRTFNLKHLIQALSLNLRNGIAYIILFIMTLTLLCFPVVIIMEILNPVKTGLWVGKGHFVFGQVLPQAGVNEVLGNFFIPVVIVLGILLYLLIIFLLKLVKSKKS
ncbi:DUF1700 domain-containing protein [Emticicia soli]|uniref:HAAS domain-containing protein n=1 Tax=Emticicia soli TaxID=2027878 RepID=A0ABW5JEF0_9BACT